MFPGQMGFSLVDYSFECVNETGPCFSWFYDVVDVASSRRYIWISEFLSVVLYKGIHTLGIGFVGKLLPVNDFYCTFGTHDGYFSRRPGEVEVSTNVFASKYIISAAVGFSNY